ncbi:Lrp/AsnC family transcriptional regulator [Hwanghaeella sp.]|uniref:Lrp/AsnC family transcriptional regulator n=1 Tax=Hwanghaeella sp. TaxID=2605943 RepID=UPI003CCB8CDB
MPVEMDSTDRKILRLLQKDATLSTGEIADRVGLSQSPCWRRIRRLEEAGVISKRTALLDAKALGFPVLLFVEVKVRPPTPSVQESFEETIRRIPRILECYKVMGERDYVLKVAARSIEDYEENVHAELMRIPTLWNMTTTMVMSSVKATTELPLTPDPPPAAPRRPPPSGDEAHPYTPRIASP